MWVVRRARIEVDGESISADDAYWGARSMARTNAVAVIGYGRVWKIEGRDGTILRLRSLWSRRQLKRLADELAVLGHDVGDACVQP
ncbi:hypothetical protein NUM_25320 [Actinocatenispora comari]|uniref:Uncharacterized protein n=1 Tax=Actinocatenispora comari TaxID=2807577 RepID=A0A8J4EKW5_9ACTN|nr:hypothetical protein NUM_25320 [Actinocatenispora comari]